MYKLIDLEEKVNRVVGPVSGFLGTIRSLNQNAMELNAEKQ